MLTDPGVEVSRPVVPADRKVFITPMEGGLRVVGTVEFGGLDRRPDPGRAALLHQDVRAVFPDLATERTTNLWMGHRPCLPDSVPVIGPARRHAGLWFAFGHGHLGLTGSAPIAQLLAPAIPGPADQHRPRALRGGVLRVIFRRRAATTRAASGWRLFTAGCRFQRVAQNAPLAPRAGGVR